MFEKDIEAKDTTKGSNLSMAISYHIVSKFLGRTDENNGKIWL